MEIINLSFEMLWVFVLIFGICEFGERLNKSSSEEINYTFEQSAWYLFPRDVQSVLPFLIMVAQKPVDLDVFGSISCSRITFKKVFNFFYFPKKSYN